MAGKILFDNLKDNSIYVTKCKNICYRFEKILKRIYLYVKISNQEEKNKINIFVDKTDAIENIKNQLVNRLITPEKKLFFDGKLLENNLTYEQSNIKEEAILSFAKDYDKYLSIWFDYEERNFVEKKQVPKITLERILVKTFKEKIISIFVEQSDTLEKLNYKLKIY